MRSRRGCPGRWPRLEAGSPSSWLPVGLAIGWLALTVLLGVGQASRIIRFRGRLRSAVPAPDDLVEEAERIGQYLGVRVPELLVVPELGTPMLWCLGRPKLLLPAQLVKTLDLDRWRGILAHELAHIRRGDHWVSRLELIAGLIWWWNPVYWLARTRLDAEAELACDAWVVWTLPKDRLAYAEALFDICSTCPWPSAGPALGAAGSGRFFERRLTMILHDHVPCRLSPLALLVACLLALFALPSWSAAKPAAEAPGAIARWLSLRPSIRSPPASIVDDDDDDDDDGTTTMTRTTTTTMTMTTMIKKARADAKKAEADPRRPRPTRRSQGRRQEAQGRRRKPRPSESQGRLKSNSTSKLDAKIERQEIEGKFGPDFEKKMEELGEKIEKEIEGKFGPDFEKKMEALGKEMESEVRPAPTSRRR